MRIGEIIGRVTLSRSVPEIKGGRLLLTRPLPFAALAQGAPDRGEDLVLYDELGAGAGAIVAISEGREAANPFGKVKTPIDAYCACLFDSIDVDPDVTLEPPTSSRKGSRNR